VLHSECEIGYFSEEKKSFECETWFVTQSKGRSLSGFEKAVRLLGQCSDVRDRSYQLDELG
jgi:hypothetical protein